MRLYTYIDDIEGRHYNDEESDEVGEKKPEEKEEVIDAQEQKDKQELAELLSRKPAAVK